MASLQSILPNKRLDEFSVSTDSGSIVHGYSRGTTASTAESTQSPVLVLIHGYPSRWRQVIRNLPDNIPLFVPDIPGYGNSTPSKTAHDKATVGRAILSALSAVLQGASKQESPRRIILAGHDRGARICHRLSVDAREFSDKLTIVGTILMDIVPTSVQWRGMANPVEATGFFHWPFLANVELATSWILKIGGDLFVRELYQRWAGSASERGHANLVQDGALDVYEASFKQESVIRASCLDYEAAATIDVERQKEDQASGRKIEVPTLILHSAGLGKRFDIPSAWKEWVADGKDILSIVEIGEGAGHTFPEEAPEATTKAILDWAGKLGFT